MVENDGYPAIFAEYDPQVNHMALNNLVWDIERGNLLKLVEGKIIARAYHGTK